MTEDALATVQLALSYRRELLKQLGHVEETIKLLSRKHCFTVDYDKDTVTAKA